MSRVLVHLAHRNLVRAPIIFGALAINLFRARPSLRGAKHNHRPAGPILEPILTRVSLDALNFADHLLQGGRHQFVHFFRLVSLDEIGRVAITTEELIQLLVTDAGQNEGLAIL